MSWFISYLSNLSPLQYSLLFGSIFLWLCIYIPLLLYNFHKYYKQRNHVVYRARYAKITTYEAVFVITKIIFDCFDNSVYLLMNTKEPSLFVEILNCCNTLLAYLVIYSWTWRIWMISYGIIWTNLLINHEWKCIINNAYLHQGATNSIYTMDNKRRNWYISNKTSYGNYEWVKWRLLLLVILSFCINAFCNLYSVLYFGGENNEFRLYMVQFIGLIPMIVPYIFLIIIYGMTPKYEGDNFYILAEIKYIILCLFSDYFVAYCGYTLFFALYKPKMDTNIARIVTCLSFHVGVLSQFIGLLISTMWVNKKVSSIVNHSRYKEIYDENIAAKLITVQPAKCESINDIFYAQKIKIKHVISHELSLQLFINHLSSEFCIECILSLIEFLQFQKYVSQQINYKNDKKNKGKLLLCDIIIFHDSIPKSQIVYNILDNNDLRIKAYRLYEKYIKSTTPYEINISFNARKQITNFMQILEKNDGNITEIELMNIFNECCSQMMNLMKDSFSRFKSTTPYQQIVNSLNVTND